MTTVAPQLCLSIQTGIITSEDGPQIIGTLPPLESSSHHTLRAAASRVAASTATVERPDLWEGKSLELTGGGKCRKDAGLGRQRRQWSAQVKSQHRCSTAAQCSTAA